MAFDVVIRIQNFCYAKHSNFDLRTTSGEMKEMPIVFKNPSRPFKRCLILQARLALIEALKNQSIDPNYLFDDKWSEGMTVDEKLKTFTDFLPPVE